MRRFLKQTFLLIIKFLGIYLYCRHRQKDAVVILTYHSVVPKIPNGAHRFEYHNAVSIAQFEWQIKKLLRWYKPVSIDELVSGNKDAFKRGFLITFDDGFKNNLTYALPLLKKYGVQACFFITTGLIGQTEMIWTERITCLLCGTRKNSITVNLGKPVTFTLNSDTERENASREIRRFLKSSSKEHITQVLAELEEQAGVIEELDAMQKNERYTFLSWDDVRELIKSRQIIGSHTHNHEVLSTLNIIQSDSELKDSRRKIEDFAGSTCRYFSYPNGAKGDFSDLHKKQIKQSGYVCAMTQIPGNNYQETDKFALHRINIDEQMTGVAFEAAVCGFLNKIRR